MKLQPWPSVRQGAEKSVPQASCHAGDIVVDLRLRTKEARKIFKEVIATRPDFCVQNEKYDQSSTAQLIILEVGFDHYSTFDFIEAVTQNDTGPDIFLTAEVPDMKMMAQALRIGVKEFFLKPLQIQEITEALDRCAARRGNSQDDRKEKMGEVISFFGGRGGIGTTTIAVNFGTSLRKAEKAPSVVLVELNQHAGDLGLFLNLTIPHTLRDLRNTSSQLDQVSLNRFLVKHGSGLHALSSGYTDIQANQLDTKLIEPIFKLLRTRFDFVLIDCGHTLDTTTTTALGLSSTIIVLSTLTMSVVKRTELILDFFMRAGIPSAKIQWVLNRYIPEEDNILKETEQIFNCKTSWFIPNDFPRASQGMNSGCPLVLTSPNSAIGKSFRYMASCFLSSSKAADSKSSKSSHWVNSIWSKVTKGH